MSELLSLVPVAGGTSRIIVDDVGVKLAIPAAGDHSDLEMWLIDGDSVHFLKCDAAFDETTVDVFVNPSDDGRDPVMTTGIVARVDTLGFTHVAFKCETGTAATVVVMGVTSKRMRTRSE